MTLADDRSIVLVTGAAGTAEPSHHDEGVAVDSVEIEAAPIASLELAGDDPPRSGRTPARSR